MGIPSPISKSLSPFRLLRLQSRLPTMGFGTLTSPTPIHRALSPFKTRPSSSLLISGFRSVLPRFLSSAAPNDSTPKGLDIHHSDLESEAALWDLYKRWMSHYKGKVYMSGLEEMQARFSVFKEQVKFIHTANNMGKPYQLGLNVFSDMTEEEFQHYVGGPARTFSAMAAAKGMNAIKTEKLDLSSVQHVLGDVFGASSNGGGTQKVNGFMSVRSNDEEALKEAVSKQPVIAVIDARGNAFKNYSGGVLTEEFGKMPIHSVCITGYGATSEGVKYWTVLNCWDKSWGMGGYMRMARGVNLCGIASKASYPFSFKDSRANPTSRFH